MAYRKGLLPHLYERELLGHKRSYVPNQFSHAFTCEGKHAGMIRVDPNGESCPPYCITYNKIVNGCRFLTVGDEEGCVSIVDTRAEQLPTSLYTDAITPPRAKWLAHNNTIFDMAWAKNDSVLYTASGDQQVGVWDTTAGRLLMYCAGHNGSVKAVSPHSSQPDMFASGSRDGAILLWDLRTPSSWSAAKRRMQLSPVMRVDTATAAGQLLGPSSSAAATAAGEGPSGTTPGSGRKVRSSCVIRRSVTSLLFVKHEHTLISSSDCDGIIKLWDLRKMTLPTGDITLPSGPAAGAAVAAAGARTPGSAGRRTGGRSGGGRSGTAAGDEGMSWLGFGGTGRTAGITCMALSSAGDMLLVSSIDSCHYLYRVSGLDREPLACLTGHRTSSFCVKSCFSPSGSHVLSGSTDKRAYIWDVSRPSDPPASLSGHAGEVTAVAWCPGDHCQMATSADDGSLRVWTMDRANTRYQRECERANVVFPGHCIQQREQQEHGLWERSLFAQHSSQDAQKQATAVDVKQTTTAAAAAVAAPTSSCSVATADGAAAAGAVRSICSPVTPQLPFWNAAAAAAGDGSTLPGSAGKTAGAPAAVAEAVYQTPASRKCKAVPGVSPSLPPLHPASAARHSATPKLKQMTIAQQLSAIKARQESDVDGEANASTQGGNVTGLKLSNQQQQQQQADVARVQDQHSPQPIDSASNAGAMSLPAVRPPAATTRHGQEQHSSHLLSHTAQLLSMDGKAEVTAPGSGSPAVSDQQLVIADWMKTLTPSPLSSPESQQQQQQQQDSIRPVGLAADSLRLTQRHQQRQQQRGSRASYRRGGVVELSTPWDLPTPLQQQRQQEQAALEAERLQQSMRLRGLSLHECDGSPGSGVSHHDAAAAAGSGRGGASVSCCRLLQDDFEVYCDLEEGQTAGTGALDSQGTAPMPRGLSCQEDMWQQQQLAGQQPVEAAAATAAAPAGDDVIEESPADIDMVPCSLPPDDMVPCSLPAQELTQQTQQQQQQPEEGLQQSRQQQQQDIQVQGVSSPNQHQQQQMPSASLSAVAAGVGAMLLAAGIKPGVVLLAGAARTPLGDLSPLLPAQQDLTSPRQTVTHSPAANIAAGHSAGAATGDSSSMAGDARNAIGLCVLMRNSPVRALQMTAGGSAAGVRLSGPPACQLTAATAADSPVVQMLMQGKQACQQQRQQQQWMSQLGSPKQPQRDSRVLLSPPRQCSSGGRRLSRLGDRQISPLMASRQLLAAASSPQQQQQIPVDAAAGAAGGILSMLQGGTSNNPCVIQQQQQQQQAWAPSFHVNDEALGDQHQQHHQHLEEQQQQTPASTGGKKGGIKRSNAFGGNTRKKQSRLSDLWTAKEPEVEDEASRFSGF